MDNPKKLATSGTQNNNTAQYVLDTTLFKEHK